MQFKPFPLIEVTYSSVTNNLENVLPLIQIACFFLHTQLQVLWGFFFNFVLYFFALISPLTRRFFDTVSFLNKGLVAS